VEYDDARRWLERVDPAVTRDRSPQALLDHLKQRSGAGPLTGDAAAAWYALVHEMRRLADYYERDLIRKLRADDTLGKLQEKWFGFRMNLADKVPAL